jgi:hypothetical protein
LHGIEIGRKNTKEFTCNTYIPDRINNEEKVFSCMALNEKKTMSLARDQRELSC